jgi:hypothetical protein
MTPGLTRSFLRILVFALFLASCSAKKEESLPPSVFSNLPDVSSFASSPSDQFIVDAAGLMQVSRAHPYKGAGTSCAHSGAHLHFKDTGSDYRVEMRAPADGVVARITPCFDLGNGNDKFEVDLAVALHKGEPLLFEYSIEPFAGLQCQANPDFYKQFIFVSAGQNVKKGDVIALLFRKGATGGDATHVHFNLQDMFSGNFYCPNVFNDAVEASFSGVYGSETCAGVPFGPTFCYQPAAGEDLTGL